MLWLGPQDGHSQAFLLHRSGATCSPGWWGLTAMCWGDPWAQKGAARLGSWAIFAKPLLPFGLSFLTCERGDRAGMTNGFHLEAEL